jgi:hypothetical protein
LVNNEISSNIKVTTMDFATAIAHTESLMNRIETGDIKETEIETAIASLVQSKDGARGFFVAYLTSELTFPDNPSIEVINALQSSPQIVSELLVKNLAMSAAMAVTHRRNQDEEKAKSSERVCQRSGNLIQQMNLDLVNSNLKQLETSLTSKEGSYQNFLHHWGYDSEQKQAIKQAIANLNYS